MFCGNIDDLIGFKLNLDQRKAIENSVTSSFSLIQGPPGLYFSNVLGRERRHQPPPLKSVVSFSYNLYLLFPFCYILLLQEQERLSLELYLSDCFVQSTKKYTPKEYSLIFANKIQVQKTAIMLIQGLP